MILSAVFALFIANGVSSTVLLGDPGNGEIIPIDVTLNDGIAILVTGQAYPPQDFYAPSINMFDFDKQLEARKLIDDRQCFIREFAGSYAQFQGALDGSSGGQVSTQVVEQWNIPGDEIPADKLEETIGEKLAKFCFGYKVFWLGESREVTMRGKRQWTIGGTGGYTQGGGWTGSGGVTYDNGSGISGSLGGGYSTNGGWSASATVSISFGK